MSTPVDAPPRLRADVSIRPFDVASGPARYVVAVDDRHFIVNEAVAALLEATREAGTLESIARRVSGLLGRCVTPAQAECALREKIPAVVFEAGTGSTKTLAGPLLCRVRLLSSTALAPLLGVTSRLFAPARVAMLLTAFSVVDVLIGMQLWHNGTQSISGASPFGVMALVMLGVLVHEIGHLSACHRYGGKHGGIGLGLYWFIPAFYAEVHGAWMLTRAQRAVVDIGGVYFQCLFLLLLCALHLWRPSATYLMALLCSHFLLLNTLNPVLKFDGYWLLSDLSGSHNLHRRIRESARLCWRSVPAWPGMSHARKGSWPSRTEVLLLVLFLALALAYFSYAVTFIAHNYAYALSRLASAWSGSEVDPTPWWEVLLRASGLALLTAISLGIAFMLARAIREVTSTSPLEKSGQDDNARVTDAVA